MVEHISGTQGQLPMNFFNSYGVDCKTVRILAYSRGSQTKGLERGWKQRARLACEARALRLCKTLTPRFTDFFPDFEKKKPTVLQSSYGKAQLTNVAILSFPAMMTKASPVTADSLIASPVNTVTLWKESGVL